MVPLWAEGLGPLCTHPAPHPSCAHATAHTIAAGTRLLAPSALAQPGRCDCVHVQFTLTAGIVRARENEGAAAGWHAAKIPGRKSFPTYKDQQERHHERGGYVGLNVEPARRTPPPLSGGRFTPTTHPATTRPRAHIHRWRRGRVSRLGEECRGGGVPSAGGAPVRSVARTMYSAVVAGERRPKRKRNDGLRQCHQGGRHATRR